MFTVAVAEPAAAITVAVAVYVVTITVYVVAASEYGFNQALTYDINNDNRQH